MVEELHSYIQTDVENLDSLMHELSPTSYCNEAILNAIIRDKNSHAYVIREGSHIVAAGTLCVIHTLEFTNACIESVAVSTKQRGKGLGRLLVEHMINEARKMNVHSIHLTKILSGCQRDRSVASAYTEGINGSKIQACVSVHNICLC